MLVENEDIPLTDIFTAEDREAFPYTIRISPSIIMIGGDVSLTDVNMWLESNVVFDDWRIHWKLFDNENIARIYVSFRRMSDLVGFKMSFGEICL